MPGEEQSVSRSLRLNGRQTYPLEVPILGLNVLAPTPAWNVRVIYRLHMLALHEYKDDAENVDDG